MRVKGVLEEKRITLPELKEELLSLEAKRRDEGRELSYELRRSIEHATRLSRISAESARKLVEELLKLEKMKPDIAYRITNIMPKTRDELRAIYAKERFTLTGDELDEILGIVAAHL